ncbi:rhodanese-like domain-containing protein [Fodinibius sp. Rm-B-1B1-1]|uniref:rhodanese-like domain-containing protein n=1 Tax=Fodinibius alkaliphilus TaxID=3140241 RepID=UPI00315A26BC
MIQRTFVIFALVISGILLIQACGEGEQQTQTEVKELTGKQFQQQKEQQAGVIIDVRTQEEYDNGHLAEVDRHYNLLNGDFEAQLDSLEKDETYYLYCRSGNRSEKAAKLMIDQGFEKVYNIGGFQDLVDAGVESKK